MQQVYNCPGCNSVFRNSERVAIWWNSNGSEDVKLCQCPICNRIFPIKYINVPTNLNFDSRYYEYDKDD